MFLRLFWLAPAALLAAALALRAADPPALEAMRHAVFDELQALSPEPARDAGVRVVAIDAESLRRVGPWPWPRTQLALLTARLSEAGAAAIAFAETFAEPDPAAPARIAPLWASPGDDHLRETIARLPDSDAAFAAALGAAPSVLSVTPGPDAASRPAIKAGIVERGPDPRPLLRGFAGASVNLPRLDAAAMGVGHASVAGDGDGVVRRVPLFAAVGGDGSRAEIVPALALEAVRVALRAEGYAIETGKAIESVRIGQTVVATDGRAQLWLRASASTAEPISAWRVLAGDVDAATFAQAIVFVETQAGAATRLATSLGSNLSPAAVHARAAEQIRLGSQLQRPGWADAAEMLYLLGLGAALIALLARVGPIPAAIGGAVASLAAFAIAYGAFRARGVLLDPLYPSVAAIAVYLATAIALAAQMQRARRRVRAAFGRQIAAGDAERLASDPSRLDFHGETRDVSVLFCGVRDFAHLAEALDAAALTRFLNRWLTFVSEIVVRHRGTVGRCMGSRLMAFWNAPLDDPDHARHAAQAALEIAAALERFNRDSAAAAPQDGHAPAVAIGLGLNTGAACVGDLGSALRFDYSVVGATVDHAERMEEQAKAYGVPVVIGETTRARLDGFAVLELDRLHLRSRDRPVRVFALIGAEEATAETWFRAMAEAQTALVQALRAGEASRAVGLLELCRWAAAGRFGALWDFYAARIAALRRVAPPERETLALVRRK